MLPTYRRYTVEDLPISGVEVNSPTPHPPSPLYGESINAVRQGLSYTLYPDGQLKYVFGRTHSVLDYLWLEQGNPGGYFWIMKSGEMYYADGRMEDFSPWDDSSPHYPAELDFPEWVAKAFELLGRAGT